MLHCVLGYEGLRIGQRYQVGEGTLLRCKGKTAEAGVRMIHSERQRQ